ncbi:TPA: hypothetical protein DCZ39_05595 [Patescibacteria group bacterium]|nr:hypothetical protein [Candidatus Gracilibacteria bacterium]
MNAEYAWIKRHCRDENNKLDRSIFMDKCIDEDLVEQINFEQIRVNFEPKDIKVNFRSLLSEMVKK